MTDSDLTPGWSNRGTPAVDETEETAEAKVVETDKVEDKAVKAPSTKRTAKK